MSFEEPKAPIVRIRKKRTKKKSKDNDIVHLPVRASQHARYSSLTTPQNPQTKGRECCRHTFASCMKIPLCRLICFRCILPKCYSGEGSDEEETNIKDEGYHSQNRRSSEIVPIPEGGAQGGAEANEVEMTEIKSETVTLIPPPRTTVPRTTVPRTAVNDYRRDPCKSAGGNFDDKSNGEVTYIEVESVSLTDSNAALCIPDIDAKSDDAKEFRLETFETCYEEPIHAGVLDFPILKMPVNVETSEYVECDNSDDSESRIYVNESVLGIVGDSSEQESCNTLQEDRNYINIGTTESDRNEIHSNQNIQVNSQLELEKELTSDQPHEYVNFTPLECNDSPHSDEHKMSGLKKQKAEDKYNTLSTEGENNEKPIEQKIGDEKQAKKEVNESDILTSRSVDTNDHIDNGKDHVIDNSDAEKLIKKNKEKAQETDTDSREDMEDHSENGIASDKTKLI